MQTARSHELKAKEQYFALINEVQIVPIKPTDGIVGFASFVLNGSLYLGSIAIISRPNGEYRLLYPTKKVGGVNFDIFHPINRELGQQIEEVVIAKFEEVMKQGNHDEQLAFRR